MTLGRPTYLLAVLPHCYLFCYEMLGTSAGYVWVNFEKRLQVLEMHWNEFILNKILHLYREGTKVNEHLLNVDP